MYCQVGCPTTYSCHVDSVHFYSKVESNRSGYRDTRFGYFRIGYSYITRWTWHFRIYFEDIREYLVSGNSLSTSGGTHRAYCIVQANSFARKSFSAAHASLQLAGQSMIIIISIRVWDCSSACLGLLHWTFPAFIWQLLLHRFRKIAAKKKDVQCLFFQNQKIDHKSGLCHIFILIYWM